MTGLNKLKHISVLRILQLSIKSEKVSDSLEKRQTDAVIGLPEANIDLARCCIFKNLEIIYF